MIPVNRPLLTEEDLAAVTQALGEGWISGEGPYVAAMEEGLARALGVDHAIAVSSGTTACDLVIEALPIGPGDEIVAPALTIISTVSAAARHGARITLVDADPETWCMNSSEAAERITSAVRLVLPVHIFGLPVDVEPIVHSAREAGAAVIEDAAEAIGLHYRGRPCGSLADGAVFSFYANKTVTGGEGGALVTGDSVLAERVRSLRNLCFSPEERFVHHDLGFNARMSSLVAALIASQISRLPQLIARKRQMGQRYQEGLMGHPWLQLPLPRTSYADNSYWVFGMVLLDDAPIDAREFQERLRSSGVDSRRFFCPMNLQPALRDLEVVTSEPMPVAERLWHRGIYVPCGIGTTDDEIDKVIDALWRLGK